jgi:hypothetical protein
MGAGTFETRLSSGALLRGRFIGNVEDHSTRRAKHLICTIHAEANRFAENAAREWCDQHYPRLDNFTKPTLLNAHPVELPGYSGGISSTIFVGQAA